MHDGGSRLRVLHVAEATVGGIRLHVHNLAFGLNRDDFATGVACPPVRRNAFGDDDFVERLREREVPVHLVPMRREPHPAHDLRALVALLRLARQYDVVHAHSSKAGFLARLAGRLAGAPAVVYTPNAFSFLGDPGAVRSRVYFALERFAARFTDVLIACSPSEARAAERLLPRERIRVIPNAVDVGAISATGRRGDGATGRETGLRHDHLAALGGAPPSPQARSAESPRRPVTFVGMVARLVPQKAPEVFVRAAAHVARARPEVRFWVAGDGELRAGVEALAEQLGVASAIEFMGHRRDVPALLRASDLFVLTSRYEGLPYSVLEAMACGLPVVATRAPGTVDVVEDGVTGILVPVEDAEAVATAILALLDDPARARALGEAGRRHVAERFSLAGMLAAHEALYRELCAGGKRRR
jgi:glycosyltransferase involved in cell wall biosynthesis